MCGHAVLDRRSRTSRRRRREKCDISARFNYARRAQRTLLSPSPSSDIVRFRQGLKHLRRYATLDSGSNFSSFFISIDCGGKCRPQIRSREFYTLCTGNRCKLINYALGHTNDRRTHVVISRWTPLYLNLLAKLNKLLLPRNSHVKRRILSASIKP